MVVVRPFIEVQLSAPRETSKSLRLDKTLAVIVSISRVVVGDTRGVSRWCGFRFVGTRDATSLHTMTSSGFHTCRCMPMCAAFLLECASCCVSFAVQGGSNIVTFLRLVIHDELEQIVMQHC